MIIDNFDDLINEVNQWREQDNHNIKDNYYWSIIENHYYRIIKELKEIKDLKIRDYYNY
jgi:hypothetical protein